VPPLAAALLLLCGPTAADAQGTLTKEQMAHFLATARIVSAKEIGKGVTKPMRLTLSDGTLTHDAAFSSVDEQVGIMRFKTGRTELDFVDSYKYTVAAYRVAELLGVDDMLPVTVEREWKKQRGSVTWWLDVKWDEAERRKQNLRPPDQEAWSRQLWRMRVFTQLIADTDRNLGNILIGEDWKLWLVDFTRAFRRNTKVTSSRDLTKCDRELLARLRLLTKEELEAATRGYLGGTEIEPLLARRDAIVAVFDKLVAARGEASVLY
jgi:hypothetical protein